MLLFGVPEEVNTKSNESHWKGAKYAAKLTQRNEATFNTQTAERLTEFLLIDLAMLEIKEGRCLYDYYKYHNETVNAAEGMTQQQIFCKVTKEEGKHSMHIELRAHENHSPVASKIACT